MITVKVTADELIEANACADWLAKFVELYPDGVDMEWTHANQIAIVTGQLKSQIGWARMRNMVPSFNLSGADLSSADLSRADLRWTDLSGADLSGADLRSADLSRADLRFTDLSGADLRSADLSRALSNAATQWPIGFDYRSEMEMES